MDAASISATYINPKSIESPMARKYSTIFTLLLVFLLAVTIVYAETYYERAQEGTGEASHSYYTDEDARFPDWYDVSAAEWEFCSLYGGPIGVLSDYQTEITGDDAEIARLTFTLQAFVSPGVTMNIYELAWYVHPFEEGLGYTVYAVEEGGSMEEIFPGYAEAIGGSAGYEAFESDTVYTSALLVLEEQATSLEIPFVEKTSAVYDDFE
jgi:hypothetical protein